MCIRWLINWSDSTKMHGATIRFKECENTRTEAFPSATCAGTFSPHFRNITTCFSIVCFYVSVWIFHFKNYYTDFEKKEWLLPVNTNICRGEFRSNCGIRTSKIRQLLNAEESRHFLWKPYDSLRDCRILQLCLWGIGSFVVWRFVVGWLVPYVSKDNGAFVFRNKALQFDCL